MGALLLGGCDLPTFGSYTSVTTQGHDTFKLYSGMMIAGIVVGGIVALLIFWSVFRYRRRSEEMPRQFQYQFHVEIIYTVLPIIIVLVLFWFTVLTENNVDAVAANPAVKITVTAFQWGWEFDYTGLGIEIEGETTQAPQMVLPVGETAQITLVSRDVIHGFYVPEFDFSRYAQPGVTNVFDVTLKNEGTFRGQCTQFCGLYHSLMFFSVKGVSPDQFSSWAGAQGASASSAASGQALAKHTSQEPAPT
jgi:cytochrome c oxidase subunit 2